jgi:hypothetical protein
MDQLTRERFDAKINASGDCHIWTGARSDVGYGQIRIKGKLYYAHRLAYELERGPIPDGMVIDHMCHNRACVNPEHIQAVSHKQNIENIGHSRSSTGYRGVHRTRGGRFAAQVRHNYKNHFGGVFDTPEAANEAAIDLRKKLFSNNLLDY